MLNFTVFFRLLKEEKDFCLLFDHTAGSNGGIRLLMSSLLLLLLLPLTKTNGDAKSKDSDHRIQQNRKRQFSDDTTKVIEENRLLLLSPCVYTYRTPA